VNERAIAKVREDKSREAGAGFDGSWVAHPDLVPICREIFDATLGQCANQLDRRREEVDFGPADLLDIGSAPGNVTATGLRSNIEVALRYLESWLRGTGAVAIHNLMEDAATAEISRSQIWQWVRYGVPLDDGTVVSHDHVAKVLAEEVEAIRADLGETEWAGSRFKQAVELFMDVALGADFVEFLTIPAYELID
jgi:malate synthase